MQSNKELKHGEVIVNRSISESAVDPPPPYTPEKDVETSARRNECTCRSNGGTCNCECAKVTMEKNITVLHGVCIIVGTIIGAGIFVSPNSVSKRVGSPAMSILIWFGGGLLSTIGAITFLELGTMLPQNGGQMVYLRKAFGGLLSFLSCWLLHVLLGGLRRAIGFLTFGKYFWAVFYDSPEDVPEWANRILCIGICWVILSLITVYPNLTLKVIDAVTFFKMASLVLIIILGFFHLIQGHTENIEVGFDGTSWKPQEWGEAWNSVLWAYNGWISLSVMLGEVKDPRMLPRIVAISMSIVTILYVLAVTSYHIVLDMETMKSGSALASKVAGIKIGQAGEVFYAVAVAVSTLGNAMCASLAASRFLQAGGRSGILPGCFGLVNTKFKTPVFSLLFVMLASTVFISFGNVFKLINTASFTSFAFTSLCAIGLLVMRHTLPDISRPIKVSLFFPVATVVMGCYLFVIPWITNWSMCLLWSGLTLAGVPVYFVCVRGFYRPYVFLKISDSFTRCIGSLLHSE